MRKHMIKNKLILKRIKRKLRVRSKISGTSERPRLTVFRSLSKIYAQIIDDTKGHTLASESSITFNKEKGTKTETAFKVGEKLAEKALKAKVTKVSFDKNGYLYHGRVKALAEGARKGGLQF